MTKDDMSLAGAGSFPYPGLRADAHADTITARRFQRNIHIDIETMVDHIDLQFFALYLKEEGDTAKAVAECALYYDDYREVMANHKDILTQVEACADLERLDAEKTGVILAMENSAPLASGAEALQRYVAQGFRSFGLVWNHENALASGALASGGLKPVGREIIAAAEPLPVMIDLAHCNEQSFYDILECTTKAPFVSHSCCHALWPHPRNLKDEAMRSLGQAGGIMGITFARSFMGNGDDATVDTVVDHICHCGEVMGMDRVCLGSDFDGTDLPRGMGGQRDLAHIEKQLFERGLTAAEVRGVMGENLARYVWHIFKRAE